MNDRLADLEKVASQVVKRISSLKKENGTLRAMLEERSSGSEGSASVREKIGALENENRRLMQERKDLRKRVRSIIRSIDKVQW